MSTVLITGPKSTALTCSGVEYGLGLKVGVRARVRVRVRVSGN